MTSVLATYPTDAAQNCDARTLARLQRLGQRVRLNGLGHRKLSESDTRALTTALLRDIDETILPRHVRVTTNAGQRFALDIAGRRLLRLVVQGSGGSVGQPDDPIEAAKILAGELKRALLRATEVTLQSARMDSTQDRSDVGCSAAALAAAMGLDLEALAGESLSDKVTRALARHASATLVLDGHGHEAQALGDGGLTDRLRDVAEDHLPDIIQAMQQTLGRSQKSGCMSFGADGETGAHLLCAFCDRNRFLAYVDARRINALLPVIQDIFAQ
ncbi:hypothetical protein [Aestuariivita boseongensis]|uniref:hypothetical protein n=1 Tax=Aestuariivita boseongensis TaxID=1470562 RepID=UPI000681B4F1|nr:hypothetical protein [Aestuariivita boseongensis]